mmetsp:Transcript_39730/g.63704  ORF Transcript_39730/g.63704 Transcript_39730/m.63704 type:complete len:381 (+) Transcript_39730:210-1352(+)
MYCSCVYKCIANILQTTVERGTQVPRRAASRRVFRMTSRRVMSSRALVQVIPPGSRARHVIDTGFAKVSNAMEEAYYMLQLFLHVAPKPEEVQGGCRYAVGDSPLPAAVGARTPPSGSGSVLAAVSTSRFPPACGVTGDISSSWLPNPSPRRVTRVATLFHQPPTRTTRTLTSFSHHAPACSSAFLVYSLSMTRFDCKAASLLSSRVLSTVTWVVPLTHVQIMSWVLLLDSPVGRFAGSLGSVISILNSSCSMPSKLLPSTTPAPPFISSSCRMSFTLPVSISLSDMSSCSALSRGSSLSTCCSSFFVKTNVGLPPEGPTGRSAGMSIRCGHSISSLIHDFMPSDTTLRSHGTRVTSSPPPRRMSNAIAGGSGNETTMAP